LGQAKNNKMTAERKGELIQIPGPHTWDLRIGSCNKIEARINQPPGNNSKHTGTKT